MASSGDVVPDSHSFSLQIATSSTITLSHKEVYGEFCAQMRRVIVSCRKKNIVSAEQAHEALSTQQAYRSTIEAGMILCQEIKLCFLQCLEHFKDHEPSTYDSLLQMIERYLGRIAEQLEEQHNLCGQLRAFIELVGVEVEAANVSLASLKGLGRTVLLQTILVEIDVIGILIDLYKAVCSDTKVIHLRAILNQFKISSFFLLMRNREILGRRAGLLLSACNRWVCACIKRPHFTSCEPSWRLHRHLSLWPDPGA